MNIKPITIEEAEIDFNRESFIEENYQMALEEAIGLVNTAIRVHWDFIGQGLIAHTAPMTKCTQYARLGKEITELFKANGFQVIINPNTTVFTVRRANFMDDEEFKALEAKSSEKQSEILGMKNEVAS